MICNFFVKPPLRQCLVTHRAKRFLRQRTQLAAICFALALCLSNNLQAESLYGVHWWDFDGTQVGEGATGGWSTETVLTHSVPWWGADFFRPLYQSIRANHQASIITRIDYNWGETLPAPTNPDHNNWSNAVLQVVNTLGNYANVWIVGNEPNILGEANGWPNGQITPAAYAQVYQQVRAAIKTVRPDDEVLVAPPSPGGVIPGVRWMAGNTWLSETIAAINALPNSAIDGFALHAYGSASALPEAAVSEFHDSYTSQLAVIDSHGETDASIYITEWARSTSQGGNIAAKEAATADFIRGSLEDVHLWNQTPGNHNIVSMSWFVHNKDYGGWNDYSLEYWQSIGNPVGDPGDMWTAFLEGQNYPAGIRGTRPKLSPTDLGDFDEDGLVEAGDFLTWQRNYGGSGASPSQGDANRDGLINQVDLGFWSSNYGKVVDATQNLASQVPEPANSAFLLLCFLLQHYLARQ